MSVLDNSIPVCRFFEELCAIPHGSGNEKQLSDYIKDFAEKRGYQTYQDEVYNLIVKVPASPGYEEHDTVILQAHLDMVCEKNQDVEHDFLKDPLALYLEDGEVKARGTTLGADDGCGVAYMMAVMDDKNAKHPLLECVFTVQEETGMQGAAALDYSLLKGRRMIGLDSTGENVTVASSAGGLRVDLVCRPESGSGQETTLKFEIKGLLGGHSGIFIDKERGNSNKLMARILYRLQREGVSFGLVSFTGGSKDNAIPRECTAVISCQTKDEEKVKKTACQTAKEISAELKASDAGFSFSITEVPAAAEMISKEATEKLIRLLYLLPNGVAAMNMEMPGLVETSDNVGVVDIAGGQAHILVSLRSADDSRMDELRDRIFLLGELFGAECRQSSRYPGMPYQADSPFRDYYGRLMKELWGRELKVFAGHAGGEGGYFAGNLPGLEMVCLGPMISDVHCPDEKMNLASFLKVYDFLVQVLERL